MQVQYLGRLARCPKALKKFAIAAQLHVEDGPAMEDREELVGHEPVRGVVSVQPPARLLDQLLVVHVVELIGVVRP